MNVIEAAKVFENWAASEGIYLGMIPQGNVHDYLISNIDDVGISALRKRAVTYIGVDTKESKIHVFLRRAIPVKKVLEKCPTHVSGFEIVYTQGHLDNVGNTSISPQSGCPWRVRVVNNLNRYTCGSSVSVGNYMDAGTLGALVKDSNGVIYGLSNNHVVGSCNHADVGLPILAPGVIDVAAGSLDPFTIGHHHKTLEMTPGSITIVDPKTNHDAAIFKIADPRLVTSYQGDFYDTPSSVAQLVPGMIVEKVGRTTGHTVGVVKSQLISPVDVGYSATNYGFSGKVYFEPGFVIHGMTDAFSDSGDSGSLIVTKDNTGKTHAVGIVVAGGPGKAPGDKFSIALPIDTALTRLGVELVSGHNI